MTEVYSRQTRGRAARLVMVALGFAVTAALYPGLPERFAIHWNSAGRADGYADKPWGAWVVPLVLLAMAALFEVLPRISPRRYALADSARAYSVISAASCAFMLLVQVFILLVALGATVSIARVVPTAVGVLFVIVGNYLGKTTRNFFMGIRTPWTLASDEVWSRTHRFAGKCWVSTGIALIAGSLLGYGLIALWVALGVCVGVPVVYSYLLYRRIEGFDT